MKKFFFVYHMVVSMLFVSLYSELQASEPEHAVETRDFFSADFDKVHMSIDGGDISISPADAGRSSLFYTHRSGPRCPVNIGIVDRTLRVDCHKQPGSRENCIVDFRLMLQTQKDVIVNSGSSKLTVEGMHGALDASIGSGEVHMFSPISRLELKLGTGLFSLLYPTLLHGLVPLKFSIGSGKGVVTLPSASGVISSLQGSPAARTSTQFSSPTDTSDVNFDVRCSIGSGTFDLKKSTP